MTSGDMIQLTSWDSECLLPIFEALTPRMLQVEAALGGQARCSVYVDHPEQPQGGAIQIGVCWYIAGNANAQFLRSINSILPRDTYSVLVLDPHISASERKTLFKDLYFVAASSRYAVRTDPHPILHPLAEGYHVVPVDRALLEGNLEGAADLRDDILHFWTSMEIYDREGFGFAAVKDARIVSHSLTDYVCGDRCEIGVSTDPEHRLKGLGAHVASRTANEAFARGIRQVGWMSWATNAGSVAVSARAGFTEHCVYDVYINHWPAENPANLTRAQYRAFAEEYERQFATNPPLASGYPHLVAATAWALAGEDKACRDQLRRAIDLGWLKTIAQLRDAWPELFQAKTILDDSDWQALFARLDED